MNKEKELTLKEVAQVVFTFGKHEGKTVIEVYEEDGDYLDWVRENIPPKNKVVQAINIFMDRGE